MKAILALTICLIAPAAADVFIEKGGIVAIEAESTKTKLGKWIKKTDVKDYTGESHLEFTGNKTVSGPPNSPLKYKFKINKAGTYQLTLRARKRLETERQDISNDCFVALKGDFDTGGKAPLKTLQSDTKMYGGKADSWAWTKNLDSDHKKFPALYKLKAGETYELTISGRSKNFNIDRILLTHEDVDLRKTQNANPAESKTDSFAPPKPEPPVRTLTNQKGQRIKAKLLGKDGQKVTIETSGQKHQIDISTLSEEDQEFLKSWEPEKP